MRGVETVCGRKQLGWVVVWSTRLQTISKNQVYCQRYADGSGKGSELKRREIGSHTLVIARLRDIEVKSTIVAGLYSSCDLILGGSGFDIAVGVQVGAQISKSMVLWEHINLQSAKTEWYKRRVCVV